MGSSSNAPKYDTSAAQAEQQRINQATGQQMYANVVSPLGGYTTSIDPVTGQFMGDEIPSSIANWPAHGDESRGMSYYLAPFYDRDKDTHYDPAKGDYPYYDIENELCHSQVPTMDEVYEGSVKGSILADQVIKGDQTLWWVFNDRGNAHTETGGSAIGLEIRAQAFAFATNDEINNMTFYSYEIINRSTYTLTNTYFSPWTDVDLGFSRDDFVGCDVSRGFCPCGEHQKEIEEMHLKARSAFLTFKSWILRC